MKTLDKPIDLDEPITWSNARHSAKSTIEEHGRIMAKQAKEMAVEYRKGKVEDLETGEFVEW